MKESVFKNGTSSTSCLVTR